MIENIIRYVKVFYKGLIGVCIEIIYPFITFAAAGSICYVVYLLISL